jgi:hypothetical protein
VLDRYRAITLGVALVVLVAVAVLIAYIARGCFAGPTVGPVTHSDSVLVDRPVQGPTKWRTRLVEHTVPAVTGTTTSAPDSLYVRRFVDAARRAAAYKDTVERLRRSGTATDSAKADSVPPPPRPVLPTVSGRYGYTKGDSLVVWATMSDGNVMRAAAKLRPRYTFQMGDDSTAYEPRFTEDRAWVRTARQVKHCAPVTGVGAGTGALVHSDDRLLGAVVVGLSTLVGCLVG